jgi:hypothetical protein
MWELYITRLAGNRVVWLAGDYIARTSAFFPWPPKAS